MSSGIKLLLVTVAMSIKLSVYVLYVYLRLRIAVFLKRFYNTMRFRSALKRCGIPSDLVNELTDIYSSYLREVLAVPSLKEVLRWLRYR